MIFFLELYHDDIVDIGKYILVDKDSEPFLRKQMRERKYIQGLVECLFFKSFSSKIEIGVVHCHEQFKKKKLIIFL